MFKRKFKQRNGRETLLGRVVVELGRPKENSMRAGEKKKNERGERGARGGPPMHGPTWHRGHAGIRLRSDGPGPSSPSPCMRARVWHERGRRWPGNSPARGGSRRRGQVRSAALQNGAGTSLAELPSSSLAPSDDGVPAVLHGRMAAAWFPGVPGEEGGQG
jgi:hypothetical protein